MGLTFTVGSPTSVFEQSYASKGTAAIGRSFPSVQLGDNREPWYSEELAWGGWAELQDLAAIVATSRNLPLWVVK